MVICFQTSVKSMLHNGLAGHDETPPSASSSLFCCERDFFSSTKTVKLLLNTSPKYISRKKPPDGVCENILLDTVLHK